MDSVETAIDGLIDRTAATLRLCSHPLDAPQDPAVRLVVTDTTWSLPPGDKSGRLLVRDIAERILAERDTFAEAADLLDGWAAASGIVERMTVDGTSYWYYLRLGQWMWLVERLLDAAIVDSMLLEVRPQAIEVDAGVDPGLVASARAAANRDGLHFRVDDATHVAALAPSDLTDDPRQSDPPAAPDTATDAPVAPPPPSRSFASRVVGRLARAFGRRPVDEKARRRALVAARLEHMAASPGSLLVVLSHARQRIETAEGARLINPYLGPVLDALQGSRLDPICVETGASLGDDDWDRIEADDRLLPGDAGRIALQVEERAAGTTPPEPGSLDVVPPILRDIETIETPLVAGGVDTSPELVERILDQARRILPGKVRAYRQIRSLLRAVSPSGVLLADEYHRQEWLAAAAREGVVSAAVQHGLIYRWHNGYIHRERPASLRLPDRTYVFGDWEQRLLTTRSVYRAEEVKIGGSPRLDLVRREPVREADRAAIRTRLGVASDDRLLVLSATWGPLYRVYLYPIALAHLFDRPLPRVHVVVKLHPSERDEGPYRAVIEGVARAGGFAPPPITLVQDIDLYELLGAADAHLGIHSTVLTEAVVTGTPNLIAAHARNADLLGYVEADVATPVRTGADVLWALDTPPDPKVMDIARRSFLDDHFEPGSASERIAADLLAWLP